MSQINQKIDATAADWAARLDRGPLSVADEEALESWLGEDTRHRGAFMRMRAIALHTQRASALGPSFDPERFQPPAAANREHKLRSQMLWLGAAAAALIAVVTLPRLLTSGRDFETRIGEMRVISLEDGSAMSLNTDSRAQVTFSDDRRTIRLLNGEALFDVAKDPARPFVVEAGEASVRAIGTSFTVRHLKHAPIQVIVQEGLVEVQQLSAAPVRVAANMRAELLPASARVTSTAESISPDVVSRELAWRDGRIAFESEMLSEAAVAFSRYSPTRIVIDDPEVAALEITGLFTANDPVSFARAAAASLGLKAQVAEDEVRLTR